MLKLKIAAVEEKGATFHYSSIK